VDARLVIVAALEALEVGDQAHAVEILLGALEDGPTTRPYPCRSCGLAHEWPGLRDAHEARCQARAAA